MSSTDMNTEIKIEKVEFTGKASEYFGIWIVNVALSIVTLGLYLPWAKVRTKRYFYTNTYLKESPFDFHGDPKAILKGMLLAAAFFALYSVLSNYSPVIASIMMFILLLSMPWLVVRSLTFRLRNTSYRGLRFNFSDKYGDAVTTFIGIPILMPFTLGIIFPYLIYRQKRFVVSGSMYGRTYFTFHAKVRSFYKIYWLIMLIFIGGILAAIAIPAYQAYVERAQEVAQENQPPAIEQSMEQPIEEQQPSMIQQQPSMAEQDQQAEDSMENIPTEQDEPAPTPMLAQAIGFGITALVSLLYLLIFAYIQTATANLVWNNVKIDKHEFQSSLKTLQVAWLYLSNGLAILFTVGLAIPWAKIRMVRYRINHLQLKTHGDIGSFIAHETEKVSAIGDEIGEAFDVDVGLGI